MNLQTKLPLISVIVPIYNPGEYFKPFIDSLQNQDWPNWQAIFVDDGSTDNSGATADSVSLSDPRISVLHQQNAGAAFARAAGLSRAKGDYVICVDCDDLLHPMLLSTLVLGCLQYNTPLAFCRFSPFVDVPTPNVTPPSGKHITGQTVREMLLHDQKMDYALSNKLFLSGILTPEVIKCNYLYNEDLLANWRAIKEIKSAVYFDFDGYHCRQHARSTSHNGISKRFLKDQWEVAQLILHSPDLSMEDSINAFYYEKLLYLDSMIQRQPASEQFHSLSCQLRQEIRFRFTDAMRNHCLNVKFKFLFAIVLYAFPLWHWACRLLLKDRR